MIWGLLVVLGLCLGSFVNALVWRLHVQMELEEGHADEGQGKGGKRSRKAAETPDAYSIMKGHSMCPRCKHRLSASDLVPVLSWVFLRGKCRYCKAPISVQYPLVELAVMGLFLVSYVWWPLALSGYGLLAFVCWLIFLTGFTALAIYDFKWFLLPDRIVLPLIGLAAVQTLLHIFVGHGGWAAVESALWGVAISSGLFYVLYRAAEETGRQWIGFGDVKLGIVIGLILGGPWISLLMLFLSSLLGTLVSVPLILTKQADRKSLIPYGPFLMAATVILYLAGPLIMDAFNRYLLAGM